MVLGVMLVAVGLMVAIALDKRLGWIGRRLAGLAD